MHNCRCKCKHESVKYCCVCCKVYCEDCGQQWEVSYRYQWSGPGTEDYKFFATHVGKLNDAFGDTHASNREGQEDKEGHAQDLRQEEG